MKTDYVGTKFGRWTISQEVEPDKNYRRVFVCVCECGTKQTIRLHRLIQGGSKSCGCLRDELAMQRSKTHGQTGSRTYRCWQKMRERCSNSNCKSWPDYGGRGITVCDRWNKFENFVSDMGAIPDGCSIDRIDNNKGYFPGNVRYTDSITQANNKRNNARFTLDGVTKTLSEWSLYWTGVDGD